MGSKWRGRGQWAIRTQCPTAQFFWSDFECIPQCIERSVCSATAAPFGGRRETGIIVGSISITRFHQET